MIDIFRTNVDDLIKANKITELVKQHFETAVTSFDLEDCDRIFRVCLQNKNSYTRKIIYDIFKSEECFAVALDNEPEQINVSTVVNLSENKVGINTFLNFF